MARDERLITFCIDGLLHAVQKRVLVEGADPHARNGEAFCYACHAGRLHVAQWLRDQPGCDLRVCGNTAFVWACAASHGNPAVAQWLWGIMGDAKVRPGMKRAFSNACSHRNLKVAKWLVSVGPGVEDLGIHDNDDAVFRHAVTKRFLNFTAPDLQLARWLLSLDPHWPSWPAWAVDRLKVWSPARDAWMRSCIVL